MPLSRRLLLKGAFASMGSECGWAAARRVAEAKGMAVLSVSRSRPLVLMVPAKSLILPFRVRPGLGWQPQQNAELGSLSVRELPGLREVGLIKTSGTIRSAEFFADAGHALVTTFGPMPFLTRTQVLSVATGKQLEQPGNGLPVQDHFYAFYAGQNRPLALRLVKKGRELESWGVVRDGQILWVPSRPPTIPRPRFATMADPRFPADRATFVHAGGEKHVVLRDATLNPVWTWEAPEEMTVRKLAMSGIGHLVAVGLTGPTERRPPKVVLLSAADGSGIGDVPEDGSEALALSPDGTRMAVGLRTPAPRREDDWDLGAGIISLVRGQSDRIDISHARISGRKTSLVTHFSPDGLAFSWDGRYLIVSAEDTQVWEL